MATEKRESASPQKFVFSSSVADDVWHPQQEPQAYEWWYFDALSDDGREAIVVIFLDNFVFSPRYNKQARKSLKSKVQSPKSESENDSALRIPHSAFKRFPAVAFIYYQDGKPLYRAFNEFTPESFSADTRLPACTLGESSFKFESAPYGSGYLVTIRANLRRKRKIEARLEWLSIESDFLPQEDFGNLRDRHSWNLVSPRSDVTGSIKVKDERGKSLDVRHFRGTGYHDHNRDARWLPATVKDWQWGRAHFSDATAIYYRYREIGDSEPMTKLFLIKNNELKAFDAFYESRKTRRNIFGVKYPKEIALSTESGIELNILQTKPIDESFFYLRFLSEAQLKCPSSETREAFAITEHLAPKSLKYRWLDWLANMRIGRNGKGSLL